MITAAGGGGLVFVPCLVNVSREVAAVGRQLLCLYSIGGKGAAGRCGTGTGGLIPYGGVCSLLSLILFCFLGVWGEDTTLIGVNTYKK